MRSLLVNGEGGVIALCWLIVEEVRSLLGKLYWRCAIVRNSVPQAIAKRSAGITEIRSVKKQV